MEYNRDKLLVALYEAEGRTARAVEDDTQAPTPTTASHLQYCVEAEAEARNRLAELNRLETFLEEWHIEQTRNILEEWHKKAHEKEIFNETDSRTGCGGVSDRGQGDVGSCG